MLARFRRLLPSRDHIHGNRWLRWLAPHLSHPRLWHFSRRGVAVGVSLGVFFGLLIPIAQIPFAAGMAILLRANVPAAVGSTLVTNPVTFAPIYVLAHQAGAAILGEDAAPAKLAPPGSDAQAIRAMGWWRSAWEGMLGLGRPLLLGLVIFAVLAGLLSYWGIMLFWRLRTAWSWKRRRKRGAYEP